jgi:hypothetical protein
VLGTGAHFLSREIVVTPAATGVEGIFEAKAIVTRGTKTWTAIASMQVVNP